MKTYQFYANGTWHDPSDGTWFDSHNPTTGQVWAKIPNCKEEDINLAVQAAHEAFTTGSWGKMNPTERGRVLRRLGDILVANAEMLGTIETTDNGKRTVDITPGLKTWLADSFYYYAGLADKMEGSVIPVDAPNILNYTKLEPFGAVACITAWNSPLLIAIWKIAPALAAGNTIVLKPSEQASASTLALMEAFEAADLPRGVLNVVTGFGKEAGEPLVNRPHIRLVSFTGGIPGGSSVALTAAQQVKPVILELGGKSPQVVLADADVTLTANGVAAGIFPPGGQSCIAGSRLVVHHTLHDELVERLTKIVGQARLGDPADPTTHIGPIANKPHFDCILADIERAKAEGATLVAGGKAVQPTTAPNGWFIEPTIFTNVDSEMRLAKEEVFGPVLAVIPFETDEEAVQIANNSKFGLAAGLWTQDTAKAIHLADRIAAGTVYINNYFNATAQSPVGGYKQSGYGRENGIEGMKAFMQTKSVWLATVPDQPNPFA
ncbi:MAG: aldehyde dehydrogenase [Chloroflexota bacterium]